MAPVSTELVEYFSSLAHEHRVAHGYLVVSKDEIALRATADLIQHVLDGVHHAHLVDGTAVYSEENSIGIDKAREIKEHLAVFPNAAVYRTALVCDASALTTEAQNALLKVAEEPASHAVLILAVTDEERLLPTLCSRLQRVVIPSFSESEIATWLVSAGAAEQDAAQVASRSGGSLVIAQQLHTGSKAYVLAQRLCGAAAAEVGSLAKEVAAAEISLPNFLRALSVALAYTEPTARVRELWHRTQRLIRAGEASPLNTRLQIAALFSDLP